MPTGEPRRGLDKCDGCGRMKESKEFSIHHEKEISLNADDEIAFICNYCARYGAPMADPLAGLSDRERSGMLILSGGGMVSAAAKRMEISKEKLRDILNGRDRSVFRDAFQRLLADKGLGPDAILSALDRGLNGKKLIYNPQSGEFIETDDLAAQGRSIDTLIKLWDLRPPQELSRNVEHRGPVGVQVQVITNVGDGQTPRDEAYEITGIVVDE